MPLFVLNNQNLVKMRKIPFKREKEIQSVVEKNLDKIFGLEFIETEFSVKNFRFDTLAFDNDKKSFVILEYKNNKNFNVIDQGYAYLSSLLNNMADFVLEYNGLKNHNLGKHQFDWTQTKVIFVSPEFTKSQRYAIDFKDMPIELWEISQYENNSIFLNQVKSSDSSTSIKKITPIGDDKPIKTLKPYTEYSHLKKAPEELIEVYEYIKEQIMSFGDVEIKPLKVYIAFKSSKNFADIEFIKKSLKIWLNIRKGTLKDPRKIAKDVSNVGHHGNGDYELTITPEDDLKYVIGLIRQSYQLNSS